MFAHFFPLLHRTGGENKIKLMDWHKEREIIHHGQNRHNCKHNFIYCQLRDTWMERRKLAKPPPSPSHPLPRLNFTHWFLPLLPPLSSAGGMGNRQISLYLLLSAVLSFELFSSRSSEVPYHELQSFQISLLQHGLLSVLLMIQLQDGVLHGLQCWDLLSCNFSVDY